MKNTIYYVNDPMCSWCWGFSDVYEKFINKLDDSFKVKRLIGGLAPDSDVPMNDETKVMVQNAWHAIEKTILDIKFNFDYWESNTPKRSTYPACRAVIAARAQGELFDLKMTMAIQTAYYHHAKNPSEIDILLELAVDMGLDSDLFKKDIISAKTQEILLDEIKQARMMKANSFPSIILQINQSFYPISIDYLDEKKMLTELEQLLQKKRSTL